MKWHPTVPKAREREHEKKQDEEMSRGRGRQEGEWILREGEITNIARSRSPLRETIRENSWPRPACAGFAPRKYCDLPPSLLLRFERKPRNFRASSFENILGSLPSLPARAFCVSSSVFRCLRARFACRVSTTRSESISMETEAAFAKASGETAENKCTNTRKSVITFLADNP